MVEWQTDPPPTHGYYLGAWLRGSKWTVSELWFNPAAIGTGWFFTRRYLDTTTTVYETVPVVAWCPIPEYTPLASSDASRNSRI